MNSSFRNPIIFSVIVISFLLLSCRNENSAESTEIERFWPIELSQNSDELVKILESGTISHASSKLFEGSKKHIYTLYLTRKAKEEVYEKTGYVSGDLGYYEVTVSNPYDFDDFLEKYKVQKRFGSVEMRYY